MALPSETRTLPAEVRSVIARLRGKIRAYVWLQGLAWIAVTAGALFWITLALDWFFEPSVALRIGLLAICGAVLLAAAYRGLLRKAWIALPDTSLALLLERRYHALNESLVTSVEYSHRQQSLSPEAGAMLAHTEREAQGHAAGLDVAGVLDRRPLARSLILALLLVATIVGLCLARPSIGRTWANRVVGLSPRIWPRATHLTIAGFPRGVATVARGADLDLLVKADTQKEVPQVVQVRYRTADGDRKNENMVRQGVARPGQEPFQEFTYTFAGVLEPVSFDVVGGDDRIRNLKIRVVDSPTIREMVLHCEYPEYLHRSPRDLTVTGAMQIPRGTRITAHARTNKPLTRVDVDYPRDKSTLATDTIKLPAEHGRSPSGFNYAIKELKADVSLAFTLYDTDGIHNREPIRLSIAAVEDQAPEVVMRLEGIGAAVTPLARLPAHATLKDDYRLAAAWFSYAVDDGASKEQPFATALKGESELTLDDALDIQTMGLKPGQKLLVGAAASDLYNLSADGKPHVGQSQRYQLAVVTPEQLRAMLEARELNLRRQFDAVINEVIETRDLLTGPDFAAAVTADPAGTTEAGEPAKKTAPELTEEPQSTESPAERLAGRRLLRVQRSQQNSPKSAQETLGVATAFDDIRAELVNNRVDTEELRLRLKDRIADPLKRIAVEMFPEWDRKLVTLEKGLKSDEARPAAAQAAVAQADAIVVEMQRVRDRMLELESFNEAVDMLRDIIAAQQQLAERTKEQRKQMVKSLLEQ